MNKATITRIINFFVGFFSMSGQLVPQQEAEESIRNGVSFSGVNLLILILAILIASLGLNTNSTAVIIGAMLISPLMGPIIGIGLGVGVHDYPLIKRCLRNLLMAAGFSVLASAIYFLISPVSEGHSELLARTSPTIYDVLIGFFGGGAGIIALGSRNKGNVIPGVAIATALMPPLCTAGYGLATWQLNYFFGAAYLFVINSIYIAFATFIGVKMLGYKGVVVDNDRARRIMKIVYTMAILTMLPSIYLTYNMLRTTRFNMNVDSFIAHECRFPATQVLTHSAQITSDGRDITITLIGRVLPVDSLELALTPRLAHYNLEGAHLQFIQGDSPVPQSSEHTYMQDIYTLTQNTITTQQQTIDSLRMQLHVARATQDAGKELVPEIKVLFPQVADIAISTNLISDITTARTDTVDVALVHFAKPMSHAELDKFNRYLCARLNISSISIINIPSSLTAKSSPQ